MSLILCLFDGYKAYYYQKQGDCEKLEPKFRCSRNILIMFTVANNLTEIYKLERVRFSFINFLDYVVGFYYLYDFGECYYGRMG